MDNKEEMRSDPFRYLWVKCPWQRCRLGAPFMVWSLLFQANEADAVTVEGGLVFEAGLLPFNLKPIVAEFFGSKDGAFSLGSQVSGLTLQP